MSSRASSPPEYVIEVGGMMCQKNCATTVREALAEVPGVDEAEVTFATGEALVWGAKASLLDLLAAVEDVGYDAKLKSSNELVAKALLSAGVEGEAGELHSIPDISLRVMGMRERTTCTTEITEALLSVDGVLGVNVDFDGGAAHIWGFAETETVENALKASGFSPGEYFTPDEESGLAPTRNAAPTQADSNKKKNDTLDNKIASSASSAGAPSLSLSASSHAAKSQSAPNPRAMSSGTRSGTACPAAALDVAGELDLLPKELVFEFNVEGMSCANCARKIETSLLKLRAVDSVSVSSMTNKAKVTLMDASRIGNHGGAIGSRDILETIQSLGYKCELISGDLGSSTDRLEAMQNRELAEWSRLFYIALIFGAPLMVLHLLPYLIPSLSREIQRPASTFCDRGVSIGQVVMFALSLVVMVSVGQRYARAAVLSALQGGYGMDFLVMTGTGITFLYSCVQLVLECDTDEPSKHVYFEAPGMLLLFVTMGKYIEAYAKGRTVASITSLLQLQPKEALLVVNGDVIEALKNGGVGGPQGAAAVLTAGSGSWGSGGSAARERNVGQYDEVLKMISVDLVQRGDVLKVLPGDGIPTDGTIVAGKSYIDESMITGESVPVSKSRGDAVFGSTVNQNECIYIRVSAVGAESALAQIVRLVEAAQMSKAPVQAYADKVAGMFTPAILFLAVATVAIWGVLSITHVVPEAWIHDEHDSPFMFSLLFGISVVVISCPCALGLATPTAILVGTTVGAANGILIKGGDSFETAGGITTVVFDKTGTLTHGKPGVTDTVLLDDIAQIVDASGSTPPESTHKSSEETGRDLLLQLAASVEQYSEHPLARAVMRAAKERNLHLLSLPPSSCKTVVGHGMQCDISPGDTSEVKPGRLLIGNRTMLEVNGFSVGSVLDTAMWDVEVQGKTAVCVAFDGRPLGVIGIADSPKPEAFCTVRFLRERGIDVWMLTGDCRTTAESLADQLDIPRDRVLAGLLPRDKEAKVRDLQAGGLKVAFVGDGINDSIALARADIGVAIGAGTQVAVEAADMVLIRNDLRDLLVAIDLAKVVFARIRWNFLWACIYNVLAVPFAAGVWYPWTRMLLPPQYAGLLMACSSVTVVASSMALKLYRRPKELSDDLLLDGDGEGEGEGDGEGGAREIARGRVGEGGLTRNRVEKGGRRDGSSVKTSSRTTSSSLIGSAVGKVTQAIQSIAATAAIIGDSSSTHLRDSSRAGYHQVPKTEEDELESGLEMGYTGSDSANNSPTEVAGGAAGSSAAEGKFFA